MATAVVENDGLVDVRAASKWLSVSRAKLYMMMDNGDLQYVKLGRSRRISRLALQELVTKNTRGGSGN